MTVAKNTTSLIDRGHFFRHCPGMKQCLGPNEKKCLPLLLSSGCWLNKIKIKSLLAVYPTRRKPNRALVLNLAAAAATLSEPGNEWWCGTCHMVTSLPFAPCFRALPPNWKEVRAVRRAFCSVLYLHAGWSLHWPSGAVLIVPWNRVTKITVHHSFQSSWQS